MIEWAGSESVGVASLSILIFGVLVVASDDILTASTEFLVILEDVLT